MTGGAGADTFKFLAVTDTTKVAATHDIIKDFVHAVDKINLVGIDANANVALDQVFTFLATKGAAFTGVAGQLHYLASGTNTLVEGDTNGDKIVDFQIELKGALTLTAADFVL
jgi:serralysin